MPKQKQPNTTVRLQPVAFDLLNAVAAEQGSALATALTRLVVWFASQSSGVRSAVLDGDYDNSLHDRDPALDVRFGDHLRQAQWVAIIEAAAPFLGETVPSRQPFEALLPYHDSLSVLAELVDAVQWSRQPGELTRILLGLRRDQATRAVVSKHVAPDWKTRPDVLRQIATEIADQGSSPMAATFRVLAVELAQIERHLVSRSVNEVVRRIACARLSHTLEHLGRASQIAAALQNESLLVSIYEIVQPLRLAASMNRRLGDVADAIEQALPMAAYSAIATQLLLGRDPGAATDDDGAETGARTPAASVAERGASRPDNTGRGASLEVNAKGRSTKAGTPTPAESEQVAKPAEPTRAAKPTARPKHRPRAG